MRQFAGASIRQTKALTLQKENQAARGKFICTLAIGKCLTEQPVPHAAAVGIDVGIATLSDGTYIAPLASFKKYEERLAKY